MATYKDAEAALKTQASAAQARVLAGFFKTGKGQYGEGDKFIGVKVPQQRLVANQFYQRLTLAQIAQLLHSPIHEHRLTALLMLVNRYENGGKDEKQKVFALYIKNIRYINNWDLVDLSAPLIVGKHLFHRPKSLIYRFSRSKMLFIRRISIISTYFFIKQGIYKDTLAIAKSLLEDEEDLMHKAVGWMLREVGKKDEQTLLRFLKENYARMPRTALRYAIEKFPEEKRRALLRGQFH